MRRGALPMLAPLLAALLLAALLLPGTAAAQRLEVEVTGLDGEPRRNVLESLDIGELDEDELDEARIRRLHAEAPDEIRLALQPFGYYRPEIDGDLERSGDRWRASYRVDPGPPLRVAEVAVSVNGPGATDPWFRSWVARFPLAPGDVLYQPAYEEAKSELLQHTAENGWLDAELTAQELRIDLERYQAAVVLTVETGPRYLFGPVRFKQDFLDNNVIRGYVTFERGAPFSLAELLKLQAALSDSPYFSRVEVRPLKEEAEGLEVPIVIALAPSRRQRWVAGAGYGDDTGARGRLSLELRRLNRQGHRGEVDVRVSDVDSRYTASYLVPGHYPRTDVVSYSVGYSDLASRSAESQRFLVGVNRTESRGRWRETLGISYQEEDFTVGLDSGDTTLVVPEASWLRVIADDRLYPRNGRRVSLQIRGAAEELASDATFVQTRVEGKYVRALFDDFRILLRAEIGMTESEEFRDLPATFRFFAGGDGSVRGYDFQELGPLDEAGNVIGGRSILTTSIEADWLFFEKLGRWGLAAFWDAGNAGRNLSMDLRAGAGLGIRWLSPVGLVRADLAWPIDPPDKANLRFHLSLGPDL